MLTPTVAYRYGWLYAAGNTPATNLVRSLPHGLDAEVLSLGCGDLRNILFTSYVQNGLPARKLDITCCDYDEKIIGRNIILLTLILDDAEEVTPESLWDIYYHLYLADPTVDVALQQAQKLVPMLESFNAWKASPYHSNLKICDEDTLHDIQKVCRRIIHAAEKRNHKDTLASFSQSLQISKDCIGDSGIVLTGLRSAAPLSLKSQTELPKNFKQYWSEGTVMIEGTPPRVPNPMFAGLVSKTEILHYGTDPLLGYHLATAFAHLSENSPLKPEAKEEEHKIAAAAKVQFFEWVKAFKSVNKKHIVLRFVVSDVFAFCHTLQFAAASGQVSANWYRRQWEARILRLDEEAYGTKGNGPMTFDVIDTSNLSDHVGALNIAVSTAALLKAKPWATLYTEQLIKQDNSEQQAFDALLCGPSSTVSLLLGLTPLQYWTNAKSESHVDEIFLGLVAKSSRSRATQLHSRLNWKRDGQFTSDGAERPKLHIEAKAVAQAVFQIYLRMFKTEVLPNMASIEEILKPTSTYLHFQRGSFVALLKLIKSRVKTDWSTMFEALLKRMSTEGTLVLASNQMQDLGTQLHIAGVYTEPWIVGRMNPKLGEGLFNGWNNIPPAVAVTMTIPRTAFVRLYKDSKQQRMAAPTLVGSLRGSVTDTSQGHNMFGDVHIVFGKIGKRHSENGDVVITVEEDKLGWSGSSPLIATFTAPTAALLVRPKTALVGLCVLPNTQNSMIYAPVLGMSMIVFETKLEDESNIFISKHMPGHTANKTVCGGVKPFEDEVGRTNGEGPTKFLAEVSPAEGRITTLTGHIDISSEKGRGLLREKVPIELRQQSPFIIDIVFGGNKLTCPLIFPVPVTKVGSKTRIARTSGYIEVIAPLADPTTSDILADFISPTALTAQGLPVALNISHLNLDSLPILDLSKKVDMRWLTTLTSLQFSAREKRLREVADSNTGISNDPRVNFKESLFTMFMLASGLQGGQTGMFAITHPEKGGIHMLIFVSAIRLDGDTASVVLDAAVIPFTSRLIESGKMEAFLILVRTLECCTLRVNDAELLLWKKVLPSLAERCRTWSHLPTCEYKRKNASAPLGLELGEKVLCSCGNGRLPDNFVTVPEWETAAQNAVRIAISPTYAVPFVEDVVDNSMMNAVKGPLADVSGCRNCGKEEEGGLKLKKCMRCQKVKYCSTECQKADWKKHRMECEKP